MENQLFGRGLRVNPDVALKRQLSVLPNLYKAVLYYILWVTCDIT